ncbi:hypothetical protein F5888DRAFT_1270284 [Russula emetica]|nr:hypothetical protein F5888DRAFT_1270284 [Russula emetica]
MNTFEFYPNSNTDDVQDDIASAPWPDSPWSMGDCSYTSAPQSTHPDLASTPEYLSTAEPYFPDINATDYVAFTLAPATEMEMFTNLPTTQGDCAYQNAPDPWMPAPSLFDASSAVSPLLPVGNPDWAGVAPLAAYSATATPDLGVSPTSTTPTSPSQGEWAWNSNLSQSSCLIPASSSGHGGEAGWDRWVAPEPGVNLSELVT